MERISLLTILLSSLLIAKSTGEFVQGYNASFFDIILKEVSFKNYGRSFSVEFKNIRNLWSDRIKSLWFVDEVPILLDDTDWIVEDTTDTSTLKKVSKKSGIEKLDIKVNLYSSNGMVTVDFGKGSRFSQEEYSVSSEQDALLYLERSKIPLADGLVYTTNTDLKIQSYSLEKSLQWEVMDIPFFDRTIGKPYSFKRNIPIRSDSTSKWTYYGFKNKKSVYGRIHFTATAKGSRYGQAPITLKYVRTVKIYIPPQYYSNNINFPIFFLSDQTFFKDISSKSYRLYQCYIIEDDLNPGDAWMYLRTNSTQTIDLRFLSYKYIRYGYQTELYSIVKDPSYILDDAYCITSKDTSGYKMNKKD